MVTMKKVLQQMIKNGKKTIAVKTVKLAIEKMRKQNTPSRMDLYFSRLLPGVKIQKKKVAGRVYQIPARIKKKRSEFQLAKWIINAVKTEKKGTPLHVKLIKVVQESFRRKGEVLKQKRQFQTIVKENRSYMRFIRRRSKKKKKWVFQQRYSYRVLTREKREREKLEREKERGIFNGNQNQNQKQKPAEKRKFINYAKNKKFNTKNKKQFR